MRFLNSMHPAAACLLLVACGGGGGGAGGSGPTPVNTTPPTATIASITPAQRVVNQPVTFNGAGTTTAGGTLTYSWSFGDGSTATGAVASHTYAAHGDYTVTLTVRDAGGLSTNTTQALALLAPPSSPTITIDDATVTPTTVVAFSATATDPHGGALNYEWSFGDGSTASGANVTHAFATTGNFQVRATATSAAGLATTSAPSSVQVAWLQNVRPSLVLINDQHLFGQTLFAFAPFVEQNNLPYTLTFSFGDSSTATLTDTSGRVRHTYAAPGDYDVTVTAASAAGQVTSFTGTVRVRTAVAPPAVGDNLLQPFCSGPFCGAASASTYAGSGLGVWRYHNPTNSDAVINVSIDGLRAGLATTLVFSNGRKLPTSVPSPGSKISRGGANTAPTHEALLEENRRFATALPRASAGRTAPLAAKAAHAMVPPVGATRTWREMAYTGQTYNLRVAATCAFSTGRNGVIWVDADQLQSGELPPSRGQELAGTLCGPNGAYERLVALSGGDVWGAAAASSPNLIQDIPELQDLHVVVPGVPASQPFNGYFGAFNLVSTASDPTSNAALAIVLNGGVLASYPDSVATQNTLVHELKHLANFYQRSLARSVYHASWLEETSAMLAEDLISPLVSRESRASARVSGYAFSGGNIGYIDWTHPQGQSYNLGGSFGAFLHRRYGESLDLELMTMCADAGTPESSYDCIDDYIVRHGGVSFEDEFARMGASTLGIPSGTKLPLGFGYPGMIIAGAALAPMNNFFGDSPFNAGPQPIGASFGRTTQTFMRDYIDPGQTTFQRSGVVVPANTTLLVVVSEPPL